MTSTMRHRGPDDHGYHSDNDLCLGMRRLSIIDIEGGVQPMTSESGQVWVVLNGEIYNFQELRSQLTSAGHVFRTRSDTEAIVHAYEEWGLDFLDRLNGMFGLAVWDSRDRRLVVARDPYGVKPIYWRETADGLVFASEIRPLLLTTGTSPSVDMIGLDEFLALGYVPSPRTTFVGISKLPPGHAIICTDDDLKLHRFHRRRRELLQESESELVARLRVAVSAAVARQMVADVPVGLFLSGGVDSSAIATLMAQHSDRPIKTFTVGFGADFKENEFAAARAVANRLGSEHHELRISAADYEAFLPESIRYLEEPIATTSTLPFFRLCVLARSEVKVALTGQGADEPFAGYKRHMGERLGSIYRAMVPTPARNSLISPVLSLLPRSERVRRGLSSLGEDDPRRRLPLVYFVSEPGLRRRLYQDASAATAEDVVGIDQWYGDVPSFDPLSRMLYVDARLSLPDNLLMYADKLSMAASLEVRVPFLDIQLMDLAESIPPSMKIRWGKQKHILKQAVSPWAPEAINRKKIAFSTPIDGWFRNEMSRAVRDRLLAEGSACGQIFHRSVLNELLKDHRSGRRDYKRLLFALLTFEIWHEQFIRFAETPALYDLPATS